MIGEPFWIALAGLLAWPAVVVVVVLIALLFTRTDQRAEVLRAIAEVLRAARGAVERVPPTDPARPQPEPAHQLDGGVGSRGSPP